MASIAQFAPLPAKWHSPNSHLPPPNSLLKIIFFMQDTGALYGAERATLDLARGLRAAGEDVAFILLDEARLSARASAFRAEIERAKLPLELLSISGRFSPSVAMSLRERFGSAGGQVLHVTGYKAALHALIAGVRPVVATVHGWLFRPDLKERAFEGIERFCLRHFDRVVCLSSYYEEILLRAGVRRERLVRIPTGLDPALLPEPARCAPPPADPFTLLLAGRFSEEKNHELLLRASAQLVQQGVRHRVLLAGDGPLRGAVEKRIAELYLADHVRPVGFVPMHELMPTVHALVLCSKIENLPVSILEAMAWMRPVVATRVGGIPDLVEEGTSGLLVPSNDEGALVAALRRLIEQPALAADMGCAGRDRMERVFSFEQMIARHRVLYQEVANRAR